MQGRNFSSSFHQSTSPSGNPHHTHRPTVEHEVRRSSSSWLSTPHFSTALQLHQTEEPRGRRYEFRTWRTLHKLPPESPTSHCQSGELPGRKSPSDSLSLPVSPSRTQCLSTGVLRCSSVTGESPARPVLGHRQRSRRPWSASRRSQRH